MNNEHFLCLFSSDDINMMIMNRERKHELDLYALLFMIHVIYY